MIWAVVQWVEGKGRYFGPYDSFEEALAKARELGGDVRIVSPSNPEDLDRFWERAS